MNSDILIYQSSGGEIKLDVRLENESVWLTQAELIYRRADASLPLLGMLSFDKKEALAVRKRDVSVAKNDLPDKE